MKRTSITLTALVGALTVGGLSIAQDRPLDDELQRQDRQGQRQKDRGLQTGQEARQGPPVKQSFGRCALADLDGDEAHLGDYRDEEGILVITFFEAEKLGQAQGQQQQQRPGMRQPPQQRPRGMNQGQAQNEGLYPEVNEAYQQFEGEGDVNFVAVAVYDFQGQQGQQGRSLRTPGQPGQQQGGMKPGQQQGGQQQGGMKPGQQQGGQQQGRMQQPGQRQQQGLGQAQVGSPKKLNDQQREQLEKKIDDREIDMDVLVDADSSAAKLLEIKKLPYVVIVDKQGQIAFSAPIEEGRVAGPNYTKQAIDQLLKDQEVTHPYGRETLPAGAPRPGRTESEGEGMKDEKLEEEQDLEEPGLDNFDDEKGFPDEDPIDLGDDEEPIGPDRD